MHVWPEQQRRIKLVVYQLPSAKLICRANESDIATTGGNNKDLISLIFVREFTPGDSEEEEEEEKLTLNSR